jgi:hypothetical protein
MGSICARRSPYREANRSKGSAWVMFKPLLPAIRNFRPRDGIESYKSTFMPRVLMTSAAIKPAGPPPMTIIDLFIL